MTAKYRGLFLCLPAMAFPSWSAQPPSSLCTQLDGHVKQIPGAKWKSGSPLSGLVELAHAQGTGKGDAAALDLIDRRFQQLLDEPRPLFDIERLPGTSVYRGQHLGGSSHCATSVYVTVDASGSARLLPAPEGDTSPCLLPGPEIGFGKVLGHPAYVETGTDRNMKDADPMVIITPWNEDHWGQACRLIIRLGYKFQTEERSCADQATCDLATSQAAEVARKYDSDQHGKTPAEMENRQLRNAARFEAPVFPSPGKDISYEGIRFSRDGFSLFPWTLEGRHHVGAVGRLELYGWMEPRDLTFVVLYADPKAGDSALVPLASFIVKKTPDGLQATETAEGPAALSNNSWR